jgi:hypothetical protein
MGPVLDTSPSRSLSAGTAVDELTDANNRDPFLRPAAEPVADDASVLGVIAHPANPSSEVAWSSGGYDEQAQAHVSQK